MAKINVGDKFPNFNVTTVNCDATTIKNLVGGKTIILALRYIGCTVCRYDIHLLQKRYDELKAKDISVVVVMQSKKSQVLSDLAGNTLPFEFVCDYKQEIYKELEINPAESMRGLIAGEGTLDKMKAYVAKATEEGFVHGEYEGVEEQLPAYFVVDGDLNVKKAHYAQNLMDMPTVDDMLEM